MMFICVMMVMPAFSLAQSYYGTGVKNYAKPQNNGRTTATKSTRQKSTPNYLNRSAVTSSSTNKGTKYGSNPSLIGNALKKDEANKSGAPFSNERTGDGTISGFLELLKGK